ncbi:MAG TPA: alpha-L-fucosidase [Phycisphaerae bacterium]|nr:alpha-L-fucosidase [Phycisphaerae bacterium]
MNLNTKNESLLPTPAQSAWMALGYGMFIHFGPNTFAGVMWGDGKFPTQEFNPTDLNVRQWAEVALEAGMKYAVLTAKHHDGFCLWPSRHTDYCVRHAGNKTDVVREFVEAFRSAGLQVGLYYSLWDRRHPDYEDDQHYAEYMQNQIRELLSGYGPILELWFDGAWDKDHPTRRAIYDPKWESDPKSGLTHGQRWRWRELYELIHQLQPECLVLNNISNDRPGGIKYPPVDLRNAELFDYIWNDRLCEPVTENVITTPDGGKLFLPLEYCATLNRNWFYTQNLAQTHPSAATIADWYSRARATDACLLLNVGPDKRGIVPEYHRPFLRESAKRLGFQR